MKNRIAYSISQLIGAPLQALVHAEVGMAAATADFIEKVGFEAEELDESNWNLEESTPTRRNMGKLKMLTFTHEKQLPAGKTEMMKIQVPLLSLVPIPALQIKDAELEFYIRVLENVKSSYSYKGSQPKEKTSPNDPVDPSKASEESVVSKKEEKKGSLLEKLYEEKGIDKPIKMKGIIDSRKSQKGRRESSLDMQMRLKVRMEQADIPAGLGRLFHIMEQQISSTTETNETEAP